MAEMKTKPTDQSVAEFLNEVSDEERRADCFQVAKIMEEITGEKPKMWGSSIIGFGNKVYTSPATGREVDWMKIGFSPRKANLTLYGLMIQSPEQAKHFDKLGKYKTGKGCLYIKRLSDVDEPVLEKLIKAALKK